MSIKIEITENGTKTLATSGKYCDSNIDIEVNVAGSGGEGFPEEAFNITGNCSYKFAYNGWNWFLDTYADRLNFVDITDASNMFYKNNIQSFNHNIGFKEGKYMTSMFDSSSIRELDIKFTGNFSGEAMSSLFSNCYYLKLVGGIMFKDFDMSNFNTYKYGQQQMWFRNCYSLREIDDHFWDGVVVSRESSYGHLYNQLYYCCYALDRAFIPITENKTLNDNCFDNTFYYVNRAKDILLQTDVNNAPKVVNWKSQTIDLTNKVGYDNSGSTSGLTNYNSGITRDKQVKDDATYQALKNDPDWFATKEAYSRYNHDSAVNTINSLPDTSAYLATAGGTNTIKFKGSAGSATDGGAINTLTEAEIAVAAAKGWTVTLT